jgi:hypothetical protein
MITHKRPEHKKLACPGCRREIWAYINVESSRRPSPGDPMVCDRCTCIHTVNAEGELIGFTEQQIVELDQYLAANPNQRLLLLLVVGTIRYVRAGMN